MPTSGPTPPLLAFGFRLLEDLRAQKLSCKVHGPARFHRLVSVDSSFLRFPGPLRLVNVVLLEPWF
jgi:hypothetical protein